MSTMIALLVLGSNPLTLSFRAGMPKSRERYFSGKYFVKFGHFCIFHNPEIPGLRKWAGIPAGIRDPGIGIPKYSTVGRIVITN